MSKKHVDLTQRRSICFVSETGRVEDPLQDPSVRYRCYHPAEALVAEGHDCTVVAAATFYENPLLKHDIYVFHRPNMARANFAPVLAGLRKLGATLIADYDDLIFGDEELALVSSAVKNGTLTEEKAIVAFKSNLAGLRQFDKVTVSTEPLAARAREFNPDAEVCCAPNVIPESILSIQRANRTPFLKRSATNIGYFAGTRSHDKDFPIVEAALHRVLCENPHFNLLVVGPVVMPRSLAALPNVNTAPVVNFLRLPSLMSMCSSVIAPLEASKFNDCKSRVKFLEAAIGGCRLIASPIPDMQAIGEDRLTLATSTDDWYEALSAPLAPEARIELAKRNFAFLENTSYNDALKSLAGLK
ncbi:glycosyltransferase involved in cell wall biosynthesis [Rhodobacter sp. 140A]|nr:glycosyltransferase involved in cell wall biosynthesis [Rhodobacter sp. 140A]